MAVRQYIGARYVPILMGEWDKTLSYEALNIVTYKGNSFTSKKPVPQGTEIDNTEYWVNTGNYNAQVNEFINKVNSLTTEVNGLTTEVNGLTTEVNGLTTEVNGLTTEVNGLTTKVNGLTTEVNGINQSLSNMGSCKENAPEKNVNFTANQLTEIARLELSKGLYFIYGQAGKLSTSNIVEIRVSIPDVAVLKRNYYGNTIGFYFNADSNITIVLHATININAEVYMAPIENYLQAIRVK